jgi:NAD(P)-dependent dehydrogenase (short-subunit alcohol dehydrogenase family)
MDLGLRGRIAVVTGGASNIGRAISQLPAAAGARMLTGQVVSVSGGFNMPR